MDKGIWDSSRLVFHNFLAAATFGVDRSFGHRAVWALGGVM